MSAPQYLADPMNVARVDPSIDPTTLECAQAVSAASAFVQAYTGRTWGAGEHAVDLEGTYDATLWLVETPVTAVTSVTIDDVALAASAYGWNRRGRLTNTR